MLKIIKKCISWCVLFCLSLPVVGAPKAELWAYWQQSDDSSTVQLSHKPWQQILDTNLRQQGQHTLFDYQGISATDKAILTEYLSQLTGQDPRVLNKKEQFAYWLNLYNALTVSLIIDNYPVRSIKRLGGFFSFGPWDQDIAVINGKKISLNDIEHRILRPIWQTPLIHYGVNCASLGCPNLQPQAFTGQNTLALLDKAANEFINSDKGVKRMGANAQLSSIYDWFSRDFGSRAELIEHLSVYRPELKGFNGKIQYDYDWSLNE